MKLGIIGYGKMGKAIEEIALQRGHEVSVKLTSRSGNEAWKQLEDVEVAIEFSRPESAIKNYSHCFESGIPVVTGTTGWYHDMNLVKESCEKHRAAFFWASNFSIGVNLFWEINQRLAELMVNYPDYTPSLKEVHHTQKLDEPSGTAITTAEQIIDRYPSLTGWALSTSPSLDKTLPIEALREGDVKGTHIVRYDSEIDSIELTHAAKSRKGFAIGAVMAAEFLLGKSGFYTMSDMLKG